jgi:hypothetical protein
VMKSGNVGRVKDSGGKKLFGLVKLPS